jgi:tRNA dimethylallyltransferase
MMKPILCIAGPTASGKSAWAVELAKIHDGEIINADALQVYEEMQILSARPTKDEMKDVPHHLFGHISMRERYSTGKWLRDADTIIIDVLARGKTPILVGGTGLYFKALTEGLAKIPQPDPKILDETQRLYDEQGIDALRKVAERLDPVAAARVLGDDPQRLIRIISVARGTEHPLSIWQNNTIPVLPKNTWQGAILLPPRDELYAKINKRFEEMVRFGGLQEAKSIRKLALDPLLPGMKAIGLKELIAHLNGDYSLDEAIDIAARETRRFAKRQFTWLRGQMAEWKKIENEADKKFAFSKPI